MKHKILLVFGTRPEAIKMAPVFLALKKEVCFNVKICVTGQHREMLDQVLKVFSITPDFDLDIMEKNQSLNQITSKILSQIEPVLDRFKPDLMLVHGDTSTTFAASLSAFYKKIKIGHVEAGLRTRDLTSPWPEEANRQLTKVIADMHFTPTEKSKSNLLDEGVIKEKIILTGNTVIDSLLMIKDKITNDRNIFDNLTKKFVNIDWNKKIILVTGHRRENFGKSFANICNAINIIANKFPNCEIIFPLHLNPFIKDKVNASLRNIANIHLIEPLDYEKFICVMNMAYIIITDSGGIQEEAPSLGKPVLVTRNITERPEAVDAGTVIIVGAKIKKIENYVTRLLTDYEFYKTMSMAHNPYGDGKASDRIVKFIKKAFRK